ncbi:hypothetical protein L1887_27877 [Cichorium endivia]|nr:hypothetical protein L1887_27877 [Cichorium endivia]
MMSKKRTYSSRDTRDRDDKKCGLKNNKEIPGEHLAMEESISNSMSAPTTRICNQIKFVFTKSTTTQSPLEITVDEIAPSSPNPPPLLSVHYISYMTKTPIFSSDLFIPSTVPDDFCHGMRRCC